MTGFERLKEQVKDQKDAALLQTVDYLLSRKDMEAKYLNEEKSLAEMGKYIREKGTKYYHNGWNYVTNEVVYAWAIMYYSFPNSFLKITPKKEQTTNSKKNTSVANANNVVSLEDAKKKLEEKKEVQQISLFGGAAL